MILELLALLVLLYVLIKLYWNSYTKPWSHIPNCLPQATYPFIGNIPFLVGSTGDQFLKMHIEWLKKSSICTLWVGSRPNILSNDVKVFEYILSSSAIISKSNNYWVFEDWLGNTLFTSTGSFWRKRRKLLTPSFHFNILTEFLPTIEKHSQSLVACLKDREERNPFDVFKLMKMYTIGVILETSMGFQNDFVGKAFAKDENKNSKTDNEVREFLKVIDRLLVILIKRNDNPFYWYKPIFKFFPTGREYYRLLNFLDEFGRKVIEDRIEKLQTHPVADEKRAIFMDRILTNIQRGEVTIEDVLNETQTFLFAGFDTVATALSWCMFMLGSHPEVQQKAYKEAKKIESLNLPNQDALKEMKYIECVIKEVLRIHPSAPIISRKIDEEIEVEGVVYPKNSTLVICILAMQRDERNWQDPLTFKPERFVNVDGQRNPFAFVPFSGGPRNCIGQRFAMMELKLTLYHLLLNFEIVAFQKADELIETVGVIHGVLNEDGLLIQMKER